MQTSIRVTAANRDALARIAERELGGVSLDEALRVVLFEHQTRVELEQPSFAMCDQVKPISVNRLVKQHSATLRAAEIEAIKFAFAK